MDGFVHDQVRDLDALVVGAGFGGIYMLHKLRNELAWTRRTVMFYLVGIKQYRSILAAESAAEYPSFTTSNDILEESAA